MPEQFIHSHDDVLRVLDTLLADGGGGGWWDEFFACPPRPVPFLVDRPDENLAEWFSHGLLAPGHVLELGCAHGRNAIYLASLGCRVDAIDFSGYAIERARQRADQTGTAVNFHCGSIFDARFPEGSYDLVYDSGCFHHIAPHRRPDYCELVRRALPSRCACCGR
jgi:SAM-dependent methyltransferase